MHQETVTVQFVNAKPDKRHSSIKTSAGEYISVPTAQINMFQQGMTYALNIEMNEQYKNFDSFANQPPAPAPAPAPAQQQYAPPQQQQPPAAPVQQPPRQHGNGHAVLDMEAHKSENMAVTGIIQRCVQGTGTLPPVAQLEDMMRSIRRAWRESQRDKPVQTHAEPGLPGDQGLPEQRGIPGDDWQQ